MAIASGKCLLLPGDHIIPNNLTIPPLLIFEQRILDVPTVPGELFRRLLQMNRTLVHGAFVRDEAGKSILLHDTLVLASVASSPSLS